MPGKQGRTMIKPRVMEHFQKHPGEIQFVGDLSKQFNVTEFQISECIAGIIRTGSMPGLRVEARARSWSYLPQSNEAKRQAQSAKRVFEEIGETRDGAVIIQDESGKLYRAQEL